MTACPACGAPAGEIFHEQHDVPSHSCLLLSDRTEAERFPLGELALALCDRCGFIWNTRYDAGLRAYSTDYEETQGFSARFREFAGDLAQRLIDRYDIRGKDIVEIGCGKGEFLALLCELGDNRGTGIDPAIVPERVPAGGAERMTIIQEYYSPAHRDLAADVIVCRHTLEHIPDVDDFLTLVRSTIEDGSDTLVVFELPDMLRVLDEVAFWDIYYEHCSYFTAGSLARLFRRCGFEIDDITLEFDGQYIVVVARPGRGDGRRFDVEEEPAEVAEAVASFAKGFAAQVERWDAELGSAHAAGQRVVIWGAGSKGVSFLTTLGERDRIEYAVDIDPYKTGMYMAGTGQQIVAPAFLRDYRPDLVIAMNPIYLNEIGAELQAMGLSPRLVAV